MGLLFQLSKVVGVPSKLTPMIGGPLGPNYLGIEPTYFGAYSIGPFSQKVVKILGKRAFFLIPPFKGCPFRGSWPVLLGRVIIRLKEIIPGP